MREPLPRRTSEFLLGAAILLACALRADAQPRGTAPAMGTVAAGPFRVTLPPGWRVLEMRPEPKVGLGTTAQGAEALRAESGAGGSLRIWFACPETELGGDLLWRLVPDDSGRGVAKIEEKPFCTAEGKRKCIEEARKPGSVEDEERCHVCGVGDGRLAILATFAGKTPYAGLQVCLDLGDTTREDGPRDELRSIAMSFRVEGPIGLPEPKLPGLMDLPRPRK